MNFFNGDVKNGKFSSEECEFSGLGKDSFNNVVLGVRPEDMEIVSDNNFQFEAKIYSIELTGDQTIVSLKIGSNLITMKEDKDYENELDRIVKIKLNMDKIFLFDTKSGNRINF
jgi:multiple sugar transport system ATP-binding protein